MDIETQNGITRVSLPKFEADVFTLDEETKTALLAGQELSEEAAENIITTFEAAVNAHTKVVVGKLNESAEEALSEALAQTTEIIETNISDYLENEVINEWFEKNEVSLAESLVAEENAKLVETIKKALSEGYVEVPADRRDLVEELSNKISVLEENLNDSRTEKEELVTQMNGMQCERIFMKLCDGLSESNIERFETLVEDISIDDPEVFEKKASIIKKNFFSKSSEKSEELDSEGNVITEQNQGRPAPGELTLSQQAAKLLRKR